MNKEKETGKIISPITVVSDNSELLSKLREEQNQEMMQFISRPEQNEQSAKYPVMLPARQLVSKVAEHLFYITFPDKQPEIARLLLRPFHEYGEKEEEKITYFRQQQAINDWMSYNVLGMAIDIWVINKLDSIRKQQNNNKPDYTLDNLYKILDNELSRSSSHDGKLGQTAKDYFLQNVVTAVFPVLIWKPANSTLFDYRQILINSPEFGYINAGLLFTQQLGLNIDDWSINDIIETGQSVEVLLRQGAAPKEYVGYFLLPALIHRVFTSDKPLGNLKIFNQSNSQDALMQDAITSFLEFIKNERDKNNPFECFRKAILSYKTRPEMARSILEKSFNENLERYRSLGLKIENVSDSLVEDYLNAHDKWWPPKIEKLEVIKAYEDYEKQILPFQNIDDVFNQQNKEIANRFIDMDKIMIPFSFDKLSDDDKSFLSSARVERAETENSPRRTLHKIASILPLTHFNYISEKFIEIENQIFSNVDLLIAKSGSEKRIYWLHLNNDSDYSITRYESGGELYAILNSYRYVLLKDYKEPVEQLFNRLSNIHRDKLEKHLHDIGYAATTREKIKDFFLSLIPLYNCIKQSQAGNIEDAVVSCTMDVTTFIPVIGVGGKIGLNFGKALSHGARQALRHAAMETTLKSALRAAGGHFITHGAPLAAAQVAPRELARLGITALRSLDPGVELVTIGGRKALQGLSQLASKARDKFPKMGDIYNALTRKEAELVDEIFPSNQKVFRSDIGKEVSVVCIGKEKGRDIWVQINPDTGELFGRKYYLSDGTLELVPLKLRERLHNILTEGLGGKGAKEGSRNMAAENPEPTRSSESSQSVSDSESTTSNEDSAELLNANEILQSLFGFNEMKAEDFIKSEKINKKALEKVFHRVSEREIYDQLINPPEPEIIECNNVELGDRIGSGFYGVVYEHPENKNLVIKKMKKVGYDKTMFRDDSDNSLTGESSSHGSDSSYAAASDASNSYSLEERLHNAKNEVIYFRKYYGSDSARIFLTNSDVYVEMTKIPGVKIKEVDKNVFAKFPKGETDPDNPINKFWQMVAELDRRGIWHNDISFYNILYDEKTNTFYPVDISNVKTSLLEFSSKSSKSGSSNMDVDYNEYVFEDKELSEAISSEYSDHDPSMMSYYQTQTSKAMSSMESIINLIRSGQLD